MLIVNEMLYFLNIMQKKKKLTKKKKKTFLAE